MDERGEVHTPASLVHEIYCLLLPLLHYEHIRLYEPGVGPGIFYQLWPYKERTSYHGCDIRYKHAPPFVLGDFFEQPLTSYDIILGNLPFNHGVVHTPCNLTQKKKSRTIWPDMLKRCMDHLCPDGFGAFILPCIWLKPDRAGIYERLTTKKIHYLKTYDGVESNKMFHYQCQTPVCYVIFQNTLAPSLTLWDKSFIRFDLEPGQAIPTKHAALLARSLKYRTTHHLLPLCPIRSSYTKSLSRTTSPDPFLIESITQKGIRGFHSPSPAHQTYAGVPKIILANKRLPIPYDDSAGEYGVWGRDKYIILGPELNKVYDFLNQPMVQRIIKSFNIRMNFYELVVFYYLPDPRSCDVTDYLACLN